jgi:hypothetical protein
MTTELVNNTSSTIASRQHSTSRRTAAADYGFVKAVIYDRFLSLQQMP